MSRRASTERRTTETRVSVELNLDGSGRVEAKTGIAFFDHMLGQLGFHGSFDLMVEAQGDLQVDPHHLVEDVGICMGQAFLKALGDGKGLARYGTAFVPMDEALAMACVDISGRGLMVAELAFDVPKLGGFDTELVPEFFRALAHNAAITLHLQIIRGSNAHHMIEALFKAVGRALAQACRVNEKDPILPSTKGVLV